MGNKDKEKVAKKIADIAERGKNLGLGESEIRQLFLSENNNVDPARGPKTSPRVLRDRRSRLVLSSSVLVVALATYLGYSLELAEMAVNYVVTTECLFDINPLTEEVFRHLIPCGPCKELRAAPEVKDISPEEFADKFAYTGVPVLVKGAMRNWTATETFSFHYFQNLYRTHEGSLEHQEKECQFFPYNTEFTSLGHALNMSDARAAFQEGEEPWYIGWSNCDGRVNKELRSQYERPYFLPRDSESSSIDWIFMGGPGPGAMLHLDTVQRPSWQAQVSGTKTWLLVPSPECEDVCHSMNVTVYKGDIIVVDTNMWYHSTFIHPGEISITIGSEFD